MRLKTMIGVVVTFLAAVTTTAAGAAEPPPPAGEEVGAAASGTPLRNGTGLYPRAVRLRSGAIVASVVDFDGGGGYGAIYRSTDEGRSFSQVGTVRDAAASRGLCCSSLYELPSQVGSMPAGTLLWAASMGADAPDRRMVNNVWASFDQGNTWSYKSTCGRAGNTGGLWEPELSVDAAGRLVCFYSDETRGGQHSQLIVATTSDDGVGWSAPRDVVALSARGLRPGMPVVRRQGAGGYFIVYEICATGDQYHCAAYTRSSADGSNWGPANDRGRLVRSVTGQYFTHAPTVTWIDNGTARGRLAVVGQQLREANGAISGGSGRTLLVNTEGGGGNWFGVAAPVAVPNPPDNYCPNYSSSLTPLPGGTSVLEIATDYDGPVCKPYFAVGSAQGTGNSAGIVNGRFHRLVNVQSGHCLDVAADSREPGGNIAQWNCNGLAPQDFRFEADGPDEFRLVGKNSGLCVDVTAGSPDPGANVQQWTCNGGNAQRWRLVGSGDGYYQLVSAVSGHCLDVTAGSPAPGANVQQWNCNRLAPQLWKVELR